MLILNLHLKNIAAFLVTLVVTLNLIAGSRKAVKRFMLE